MAIKGGYKVLDFEAAGAFTSGTEKDVIGMYDAIEGTNKRTVVHGLTIGATEYDDFDALFVVSSTSFCTSVKVYGGTITIVVASDDGVTATYTADA